MPGKGWGKVKIYLDFGKFKRTTKLFKADMKKFYFLIIVAFFASCKPIKKSDFYFDDQGFLVVEISISGSKGKFIFDTCAEATVISKKLVNDLNLVPHRQISINKTKIVDVVYIPSVKINGFELFQVEAAVIDMNNETFGELGYGGILGLNLIYLFVWDFDLKNNLLQVYKNQPNFQKNLNVLEYKKIEQTGLPFIEINLDFFNSDSVFFDTGFTGFLSVNNLVDTANLDFKKITENQKFVFGVENQKVAHYSAMEFELFGKYFEEETIIHNIHPKRDKELIGNLFVQSFDRFIFDPKNSQILLSQGEK
ncbi:retropepsin-like domain-containing protein [Belliella sp. R4-6]|uniref:Retropepsin-like domain-containing protein n=1 Tax=Belliella alkalica TaxID=1730871 RepID=A0ABS9VDF3_9BACT|nr:retropepsin-like aspartic protease [Belliella alkalica]MCH7414469.1 retropepsin-like domain-containing protein [Belliella alkalica]